MMRIITGRYRGKAIKMPKGIRPTQNKIRKALFDIIGDIIGLSLLELFAGSGAVGFEAVSRGIKDLVLVENNRFCLAVIRENIALLGLANCDLLALDAEKAIKILSKNSKAFDIIFLDPPYYQGERTGESLTKKTLQTLSSYDILAPTGLIAIQHFKKDNLPDSEGGLILCKQVRHGDTILSFYKKNIS